MFIFIQINLRANHRLVFTNRMMILHYVILYKSSSPSPNLKIILNYIELLAISLKTSKLLFFHFCFLTYLQKINSSIDKRYICDLITIYIQCIIVRTTHVKQDSHFFKLLGYCQYYFSKILTIILKSCDSLFLSCVVKDSNKIKVMHNTVEPAGIHSVLEWIWINGSCLSQQLPQDLLRSQNHDELKSSTHTDPGCKILGKNCFSGKIASKWFKFIWFWIFKTSED